jgi:hypothetical protein
VGDQRLRECDALEALFEASSRIMHTHTSVSLLSNPPHNQTIVENGIWDYARPVQTGVWQVSSAHGAKCPKASAFVNFAYDYTLTTGSQVSAR